MGYVGLASGGGSVHGEIELGGGGSVGIDEGHRKRVWVWGAAEFGFHGYVAVVVRGDVHPLHVAQGYGFEGDWLPEAAGLYVPVLLSVGDFVVVQGLL